tara:strand:- start:205 stop:405 length:201 start_codon:yes stop_codon:yes gene_type:complete
MKAMKKYNVKIQERGAQEEDFKLLLVKVDSHEDFITWFKLFSTIEKRKKLSFIELLDCGDSKGRVF